MKTPITSMAWVLLSLAIAACVGVAYFGQYVLDAASARTASATAAAQASDAAAYAQRLRALAADTQVERSQLDSMTAVDIVSIVNVIEGAGKSTGVNVQVSDASSAGSPVDLTGGASLQGVTFTVQAQGTFSALMHTAKVFEKLPLPSSVEGIVLERIPQSGGVQAGPWSMTARIQVFTTAKVSS